MKGNNATLKDNEYVLFTITLVISCDNYIKMHLSGV